MIATAFFGLWLATVSGPTQTDSGLRVMTYNLRFASPIGPNSWPNRRPLIKKVLDDQRPDLVGTQEGVYSQLRDVESDQKEYAWIGLGRDGGSRGEFMAIFYRKSRFEPLGYDHFWLSDTPEVIGSTTWGNTNRRMVTWVKFLDHAANRKLYFLNTHFDHQIQAAREKSAELLFRRTGELDRSLPLIVVGDFNAAAESNPVYERLVGADRFVDAWKVARRIGDQVQTFNGFRFPAPQQGARIDWILYRGPIRAETITVVDFAVDDRYPSDHFPVVAEFRYR